jgi:hypothetical protein
MRKLRTIPSFMKFSVMFNNAYTGLGLGFTLIGGLIFVFVAPLVNFNSVIITNQDPQTSGNLTEVTATTTKMSAQLIYEYRFKYSVRSQIFSGTSYDVHQNLAQGDTVLVAYSRLNPQISVIKGMSSSAIPIWIFFFVLIFPVSGLLVLLNTTVSGLKNVELLEYGELAYGRFLNMESANMSINNQPFYKMIFEFTVGYQNHIATAITNRPEYLQNEEGERLVYNPNDPTKSLLIGSLPLEVQLFFNSLATQNF